MPEFLRLRWRILLFRFYWLPFQLGRQLRWGCRLLAGRRQLIVQHLLLSCPLVALAAAFAAATLAAAALAAALAAAALAAAPERMHQLAADRRLQFQRGSRARE